ncbi:hypothetical protein I317_04192 [Kwoniella heveanensis CBS 569]|nr:hypothetical protein I317_04192 [Kwoniella heveanensis CBS 569]
MTVIHRTRGPVGGVQSILIVLFLVVILYLFLSGGRKKGKSGARSSASHTAGDKDGSSEPDRVEKGRKDREKDRRRKKGNKGRDVRSKARASTTSESEAGGGKPSKRERKSTRGKGNSKGSDTSGASSGSEKGNSKSRDGKEDAKKRRKKREDERKKRKEKQKKDKNKKEDKKAHAVEPPDVNPSDLWEQPPPGSAPVLTPIPDHRTATPTKGIFRRRDSDDKLPRSANVESNNRIRWTDLEGRSDDVVTGHFRKWGDYTGLRNDSDEAFSHRPPKAEGAPKAIKDDPIRYSVENLTAGGKSKIPSELLPLMKSAERVGRATRADAQLWQAALQDSWDEHFGPVPRVAQEVAMQIARFVTKDDIRLLQAAMHERKKSGAKTDAKRDFQKFQQSLGVKPDQESTTHSIAWCWAGIWTL